MAYYSIDRCFNWEKWYYSIDKHCWERLTFCSARFVNARLVTSFRPNIAALTVLRHVFVYTTNHVSSSDISSIFWSVEKMPYCCAVGCKNGEGSGKSFFTFPHKETDKARRNVWIAKVKRVSSWEPKKTTVLCSDHFTRDCFQVDPELVKRLGLKRNARLNNDAVPTLSEYAQNVGAEEKVRGVYKKRRRLEIGSKIHL